MKASEWFDVASESLIADLKIPERRAGLVATMATAAVCASKGWGVLPSIVVAGATGFVVEHLYVVLDDMHQAALANLDAYRAIGGVPNGLPDAA